MDFLGIGPGELILILFVAFIIFGPGKIPEIARTLGKTVSSFKKSASDFTQNVTRELEIEEQAKNNQAQPPGAEKTVTPQASPTELH
jgi:sec-independent protein translocase protein TatA